MTCFLRRVSVSLTHRRVRESYVVILSGCIKVSLRFVLIFILTRQFFLLLFCSQCCFLDGSKEPPLIHIRLLNDFLCKKSQIKFLEIFAMPNKKFNHHSLYLRERKKMYSFLTTLQTTPALMLCLPRHTRHNHTLRRRPTNWLWRRAGCRSLALWKEKERLLLVSGSCRGERSAVSSFADWSGWFTPPPNLILLVVTLLI